MTEEERAKDLEAMRYKKDKQLLQMVITTLHKCESMKLYKKIMDNKTYTHKQRNEKFDKYYGVDDFDADMALDLYPKPKRLFTGKSEEASGEK